MKEVQRIVKITAVFTDEEGNSEERIEEVKIFDCFDMFKLIWSEQVSRIEMLWDRALGHKSMMLKGK